MHFIGVVGGWLRKAAIIELTGFVACGGSSSQSGGDGGTVADGPATVVPDSAGVDAAVPDLREADTAVAPDLLPADAPVVVYTDAAVDVAVDAAVDLAPVQFNDA